MAKKKLKPDIIKPTPSGDFVDDASFQREIVRHVDVFGFYDVIGNIIEAYRVKARRFNKEADKLEKLTQKGKE